MLNKTEKAILALVIRPRVVSPPNLGKVVANLMLNEVSSFLKDVGHTLSSASESRPDFTANLSDLAFLRCEDLITTKHVKELLPRVWSVHDLDLAAELVASKLLDEVDANTLLPDIDLMLAENPKIVEQIRGGKSNAVGFFIGKLMKLHGGKTNPAELRALLEQRLALV